MSLKKIRSKLSLIKNYPAYPGLVLPDNLKVLRLLDKMSVGLNSKEYEYRKRLSEGLPGHENMQAINAENGYLIEDMSKNDVVMNAVKYAKEVADSINWEDKARSSKKAFLINEKFDLFSEKARPILDLALAPEIIKPISEYLGSFPVLSSAALWYSPNSEHQSRGSQLYHLDGEDIRQVKCFLPIDEVTLDSGPLTILPAKISDNIYNKLHKQKRINRRNTKLTDDVIYEDINSNNAIPVIGKPGTVAFVDTCRCYHYGSRSAKAPRLVLHLHYYSAFSKMMPLWGRKEKVFPDKLASNANEVQALLGKSHLAFANARVK